MNKSSHSFILACLVIVSIICSFFGEVVVADNTYSITEGEYVRFLGRGELYKGGRSFNNPNSGIEFTFEGTKAEVYVPYTSAKSADNDPDRLYAAYFNVTIDGGAPSRIILDKGWNTIAQGLLNSVHTVRCVRSSEGMHGKIIMSHIRVDGANAPEPTSIRERRIEFYGDSYTVGYGNVPLGIQGETFCAKNTDHWKSYASFTARHFNADANVVAMSGRGVCMNYKPPSVSTIDTTNNMHQQFWLSEIKTGGESHQDWDFSLYTPQVVVVFLGTNDYSNDSASSEEIPNPRNYFHQKYKEFIQLIKERYPQSTVICCSKPSGCYQDEVADVVSELGGVQSKIHYLIFDNFGASGVNGHPTAAQQEAMSTRLISKIESINGIWNEPEKEIITVDYNNKKVNITGFLGKSNQDLSVAVSKGEAANSLSDIVYLNQAKTDAFGNYSISFDTDSLAAGDYTARISFGDGSEKQSKLLSVNIPPISVKINNLVVNNPIISQLSGASLTVGVGNGGIVGTLSCAQYKNKKLVKVNSVSVKAEDNISEITTTIGDADSIKIMFWDRLNIMPLIGVYELK